MSSSTGSLLLVGVKQEETISNREIALERCKTSESVPPNRPRRRRRLFTYQESGSSGSDWASSGDEWQPSPSPASSPLPAEVQNERLSPTTPASVPTGDLNATTCLSIPTKASDLTAPPEANTSGSPLSYNYLSSSQAGSTPIVK
ncbi:hypothetical protein AAHC03_013037 [Spirometra sp. Aus1]